MVARGSAQGKASTKPLSAGSQLAVLSRRAAQASADAARGQARQQKGALKATSQATPSLRSMGGLAFSRQDAELRLPYTAKLRCAPYLTSASLLVCFHCSQQQSVRKDLRSSSDETQW